MLDFRSMRPLARAAQRLVEDRLRHLPGVVLLGPRQVGKTTLARRIAAKRKARATYLDLERPVDQRRLHGRRCVPPRPGREAPRHRRDSPRAGALRHAARHHRRSARRQRPLRTLPGPRLCRHRSHAAASETLAGRVEYLELAPINALELPSRIDVNRLWVRGGFPESLLARDDLASLAAHFAVSTDHVDSLSTTK